MLWKTTVLDKPEPFGRWRSWPRGREEGTFPLESLAFGGSERDSRRHVCVLREGGLGRPGRPGGGAW